MCANSFIHDLSNRDLSVHININFNVNVSLDGENWFAKEEIVLISHQVNL